MTPEYKYIESISVVHIDNSHYLEATAYTDGTLGLSAEDGDGIVELRLTADQASHLHRVIGHLLHVQAEHDDV